MKKIVAIIQARMSSSRLPGKVLLDIGGKPMLEWVVERTRKASTIDQTAVVTTLDESDDKIFEFCRQKDYMVERGSIHNVLDRYYQSAKHFEADIVVRITADCPLIDPCLIDQVVKMILSDSHFDFVANRLPLPWGRTYPIGLDVEAMTFNALEQAWKYGITKHQQEHVTPYLYEGTPVNQLKYKIAGSPFSSAMTPEGNHVALMHHTTDYGHYRWTVDTPEDLELVREIVSCFPGRDDFTWMEILKIFEAEPELAMINSEVKHKSHLDVDSRNK